VTFDATGDNQPYIIPKGSQFSSYIKQASYTFTLPETLTVASANSTFEFETELYEGMFTKDNYVFPADAESQKFVISNKNVDIRSISVSVFEDNASVGEIYKFKSTLLDLDEKAKVFFLQTNETGNYEVLFGDDVLGRQPKVGSLITIDYRVSNGPLGDGARSFSVDFEPTGHAEGTNTPIVEVIEASHNGEDAETDDSIRYYAPRAFQTQERAVVGTDYEIALKTAFPEINAVTVFGGEDLNPPRFGRVYVSVDISNVDGLPDVKKDEYLRFLKGRNPFSILPILIEPEFIYLSVRSKIRYNLNITNNSPNRIKTLVSDVITTYNRDRLNDFGVVLRNSELTSDIDDCDVSVLSNITDVVAYKKINPTLSVLQNIDIDFKLPLLDTVPPKSSLYPSRDVKTVWSSLFRFAGGTCYIEDDGDGRLRVVRQVGNNKNTLLDVGSVNYDTGLVKLTNFNPESYDGNFLKIYVIPRDKDIWSPQNNIMMIENDEIILDVEALRE
jgi:hypothetical protein